MRRGSGLHLWLRIGSGITSVAMIGLTVAQMMIDAINPVLVFIFALPWGLNLAVACVGAGYTRLRTYQCQSCGYDLRGTTTGPCPECGAEED